MIHQAEVRRKNGPAMATTLNISMDDHDPAPLEVAKEALERGLVEPGDILIVRDPRGNRSGRTFVYPVDETTITTEVPAMGIKMSGSRTWHATALIREEQ